MERSYFSKPQISHISPWIRPWSPRISHTPSPSSSSSHRNPNYESICVVAFTIRNYTWVNINISTQPRRWCPQPQPHRYAVSVSVSASSLFLFLLFVFVVAGDNNPKPNEQCILAEEYEKTRRKVHLEKNKTKKKLFEKILLGILPKAGVPKATPSMLRM